MFPSIRFPTKAGELSSIPKSPTVETGSGRVGKLILEAAAPNLTPVRDARSSTMGMNALYLDHWQLMRGGYNHGHSE